MGDHVFKALGADPLNIKRVYITTIVVFVLIWTAAACTVRSSGHNGSATNDDDEIGRAFKTRTSNVQVEGEGTVSRILDDDLAGGRHQRFIVRLASDQTVIISHNIDIAPRVDSLREGDSIRFYGEYIWNSQGGIIHWTHHDPHGRHVAGWLKHKGRTYQ